MLHLNADRAEFAVVVVCPGATLDDMISAMRNRNVSALQKIHLHEYYRQEQNYPEPGNSQPFLFVFGAGHSRRVSSPGEYRRLLSVIHPLPFSQ